MRTIIHDLDNNYFLNFTNDNVLCSRDINYCVGCFKCWTHNNICSIKDEIREIGKCILKSDELIIISKCINGCYHSNVKRILERSISCVEPFFTFRNYEVHHRAKKQEKLKFKVYFYGDNITDNEKKIASKLVWRNHINLDTCVPTIMFFKDYKEIKL